MGQSDQNGKKSLTKIWLNNASNVKFLLSLLVLCPVFKHICTISYSKDLYLLNDWNRSMLFTQCFIYYQTSWNKTFFATFSCFSFLFSYLCFFKISMFHLFYFPSYWNILFLWILPWQDYIYYLVETPEYVWNMFQVTSKDTTTSTKAGFRRQLKADGLNLESDY